MDEPWEAEGGNNDDDAVTTLMMVMVSAKRYCTLRYQCQRRLETQVTARIQEGT